MASVDYVARGEVINYVNPSNTKAIEPDTIINLNTRIGVAGGLISAGELGAVHVIGIFSCPKDGAEITLGAPVFYDSKNDVITASAKTDAVANVPAGYAVAAASATASTVLIKLLG